MIALSGSHLASAGPLSRHGTAILLFVLLAVSPMALAVFGWNYDAPGGTALARFHPATYLAVLIVLSLAIRDGNPLASIVNMFMLDTALAVFLLAWTFLLWHGTANQGLPAASLIDTFLLPVLVLVIIRRQDIETISSLAKLLHVMMALNAIIGLAEFATGWRLTPYVAGGVAITDDWRSTALLGHPLSNSLLTGCYAAMLILGGAGLSSRGRVLAIGLQCLAMIAFGGRASLVILMVFLAGQAGYGVLRILRGQALSLHSALAVVLSMPVIVLCVVGLYEFGFFDKFLLRFVDDKGSAEARVIMFELFNGFTTTELLLGPSQDHLAHLVRIYRLEFGIESLWVAFALYYGILPSILFFIGLSFLMLSMLSHCKKRAWLVVGYYFAVNSTFLGIAGKTTGFAILCLMLLVLLSDEERTTHPC